MADTKQLDPKEHKQMIEDYGTVFPVYKSYADALERIFKEACKRSIPEVIVQSRAKTISSFAEKCVRKFDKYGTEAITKMTDLCGGRIIVHTLEQVRAVQLYIEANYVIVERDDKCSLLGDTNFGYRDMHYLIRLKPNRALELGFTQDEIDTIGDKIAEVQVRSVVQHAWADILHDRMYKAPLKLSSEAKRTGALLAAIMEDGDRSFNQLALELDGMAANYTAYASKEEVEKKIEEQQLILTNEQDEEKKPAIALVLARLQKTCGEHEAIVKLLSPYAAIDDAIADELLLELGDALYRVNRHQPKSPAYIQGQEYLRTVIRHCEKQDLRFVPNIRRQRCLLARAYYKLAWSWIAVTGQEGQACENYRKATETEPGNPYYLASQLGYEINSQGKDKKESIISSMKSVITQAIEVCKAHAIAGTELPYALFTAGRLNLLIDKYYDAIGFYARGLRYYYDGKSCVSPTVLEDEKEWVSHLHRGSTQTVPEHEQIEKLFDLAKVFNPNPEDKEKEKQDKTLYEPRILVVAGGVDTISESLLAESKDVLKNALPYFSGIAISGGTSVGIPGAVGKVSTNLAKKGNKNYNLIGYNPEYLPSNAPRDEVNYDEHVIVKGDTGFSPNQIIRMWQDFAAKGYKAKQVQLIGFCGGGLTKVEYYIALAMGAEVSELQVPDGSCELLAKDPIWNNVEEFNALPWEDASVQALVNIPKNEFKKEVLTDMAKAFHNNYVEVSAKKMPVNMKPWDLLDETYKTANLEQAKYAVEILTAAGFIVKLSKRPNPKAVKFTKKQIEKMAILEHGRWNVERLRNGWRPGDCKDEENKIHNCLVPWEQLSDEIKGYDIGAVEKFPEILAKAGLEIVKNAY